MLQKSCSLQISARGGVMNSGFQLDKTTKTLGVTSGMIVHPVARVIRVVAGVQQGMFSIFSQLYTSPAMILTK